MVILLYQEFNTTATNNPKYCTTVLFKFEISLVYDTAFRITVFTVPDVLYKEKSGNIINVKY